MSAAPLHRYDVDALPTVAWKNGHGTTRELVCRPQGSGAHDFAWRISIATIARDAAFSAFPGIDRSITLLQGGGVHLASSDDAGIEHRLDIPHAPFRFDGGCALRATLLAGRSIDFNTMSRRGDCRADVAVVRAAATLDLTPCGLVHAAVGAWALDGEDGPIELTDGQGVWWDGTARMSRRVSPRAQAAGPGVLLVVAIETGNASASERVDR